MVKKGYYLGYALLVFFFLLALLPMLALSFFNQPSPADDYCYIDTVQKYGFWQAQSFYYNGWSGRYFAYFLAHGNPLLYQFPAGFKIYSALLILFFLFSAHHLGKKLLGATRSGWAATGFMMVLFGMFVFYMPSIAEGFFWMITSLTNTLPVLLLFWLPTFLPLGKNEKPYSILHLLIASVLIFMMVGCSEIALLVTAIVLAFIMLEMILSGQSIAPQWAVLWLVFGLSAYLLISAPGNQVRMGGNEMSGAIFPSLYGAFVLTLQCIGKWIFKTPLLFASLVFSIVVLTSKERIKLPFQYHSGLKLVLTWGAFLGLLAACFFPTFYGGLAILGELPPPERTFNTVYLLFLSGWFYSLFVTVSVLRDKINFSEQQYHWIAVAIAGILLVYAYLSPNFKLMYRDLRNGTAYRYDQQIKERYRTIAEATSDTVTVAPLKDIPATLYIDDIRLENDHLWNRCYSGYFGKTVLLDTLSSTR